MIRFTYKGKTLAYMPTIGTTIEQVKACRELVSGLFGLNLYDIVIKNSSKERTI